MEFKVITQDNGKRVASILAWIVTLIGFVFAISWHLNTGSFALLLPIKGFILDYYSALSLFIAGLCFLNLIYFPKLRLYKFIASVFFILSALRILEIAFAFDFGYAPFLSKYIFSSIKDLPSVLLGGAINTFINSLIFLIWPLKLRTNKKSAIIHLLLSITILLSLEGIIIHLLPIDPRDLFVNVPIHPIFSIVQILFATGLVFQNSYEDSVSKIKSLKWGSIIAGFGVLVFHFILLSLVLRNQRLSLGNAINGSSQELADKIIPVMIFFLGVGGIIGAFITGLIVYLFQVLKEKVQFTKKINQQLFMSNELMQVMNEADTIQNACDQILKIMNKHYNWQLFLYWQLNKKLNVLELVHVSSIPQGAFSSFERYVRDLKTDSKTMFGEAFIKKEVLISEDLSKSDYALKNAAVEDNLKGSFSLPVFEKREVLGVIELFKKDIFDIEPETGWIELMKIIGNQFSVFIERREAHLLDRELSNIVTSSSDAIYKVDLDLVIRTWNIGGQKIYGYLPEEIIGHKIDILYPQDRLLEIRHIQESILNLKSVEHYNTVRKTKNGSLIWVENTYSPILNEKGQAISFTVLSRNITAEKEAQKSLEINEEKFRHFVESTQSWIWEVSTEGNFTFTNPAVTNILGYSSQEILNINFRNLVLEKQKFEKYLNEKLQIKKELIQMLTKNGSVVWLETSFNPIKNEQDKIIGFRGVCRDVTEEMKVGIAKNEFISMVSHELRTPLTSIIGAIGLLKNKFSKNQETEELLSLADRNADRLLKLINDILDVEKLSLGKIQLNLKKYDLANVVDEACNTASVQADSRHVILIKDKILKNIFVSVDFDRLVQVILNLLSNAIKFSSEYGVVLISTQIRDGNIRLNIQDNGPGIPYDIQGKLFEKFVQGETGDTKLKGTGLGLNISKALIDQMGGSIGFISQPLHGSTFFIDLPIIIGES